MISFNRALNIIDESVDTLDSEKVNFNNSINRILAEDIYSDIDMPPFNKSAMDGFACKHQDIENDLVIVGTIAAGVNSNIAIGKNECAKIMTGAKVPDSADCVVMKEHIQELTDNKIRIIKQSSGRNICYKAEDVKSGDIILKRGTKIKAQHVAILAAAGVTNPMVFKMPSVAIISTGDELIEPDNYPQNSQIRNSNGWQMVSQIIDSGLKADYKGIVEDNLDKIYKKIELSLNDNDIVLLSGGVSVGDYDFVPEAIKSLGFQILFHGINMKPGKRILLAKKGDKYIVGMPGNPVSSFIQFEIIVKALISKLTGQQVFTAPVKTILQSEYKRKNGDKLELVPIKINCNGVELINYNGSAHIHAYTLAEGFMIISEQTTTINKGEIVDVRFI